MDDQAATRHVINADDGAEPATAGLPGALIHIGGLALAVALAATLWVRASGGDAPPNVAVEGAVPPMTPATAPPVIARPLLTPFEMTPPREPLAGLVGARERFGEAFLIRHPARLPADVAPFTVNWQPDADPARRAQGYGELLSWFFSEEHGAVLVLAQGRGVGVWPLTATDDRAGRLRLSDGTEVIWVVGHPVRIVGGAPGPEPVWGGTEITLGTAPTAGDGWYLRSPIISLAELIRIAESLRE